MVPWTVLPDGQFDTFPGASGHQGPLSGHLLVQVSASGRSDEHFRMAVTGGSSVSHTFPAHEVTTVGSLGHYMITVETDPDDLVFKPNTFVTKWENLEDLVAAERASASTDEEEDADDAFRAAWAAAKDEGESVAVAIRWSIQGHETGNLELVLQSLPATARSIRSDARLMSSGAATLELARWKLATAKTEEGQLRGPKPTLFAADAEAASSALEQHPDRLTKGKNI